MDLASELSRGVEALRDGRTSEAVELLTSVVETPAFREHSDLQDVRARACSLLAQALLTLDKVGPADRFAREALDALDIAPDPTGREQVDTLRREIMGRAMELRRDREQRARRSRLLQIPVQELIEAGKDDAERVRMLMERATAELEAGNASRAQRIANRARNLADGAAELKEQVLTRLLVAQVDPEQRLTALQGAYRLALSADEPGLITGVARTADQLGVPHSDVDRGLS